MRLAIILVVVALPLLPALAQEPAGESAGGGVYKSARYSAEVTAPAGWKKTMEGPRPSGRWIDLVRFEEPRAKAWMSLAVQATQYRSVKEMIAGVRRKFNSDASLAILRDETRAANSKRPKGAFFVYTWQGKSGPEHAIAAYWLHLGRRYRIFGTVPERGWRTVSSDFMSFVSSFKLTSRAFSKDLHNFKDERGNFQIYFPETWKIRLPEKGARVVFASPRPDVSVYLYASRSSDGLEESMARVVRRLKDDGVSMKKQGAVRRHPGLGMEVMELEYERGAAKYVEIATIHRERLYRIVLAATQASYQTGREAFDKMVGSFGVLR